jgi:endoglucanase
VTDEVTPEDRSRPRHERDDSHYVRRVDAPALTTSSDDDELDDRPELRTTRKPRASARAPRSFGTRQPAAPKRSLRRRPGLILVATIVVLILGVGGVAWFSIARGVGHPFGGRPLWVNPDTPAAVAAEYGATQAERDAGEILAAQPTGIWLTPEKQPAGRVGEYVRGLVAASQSALPVFVIYGITDRDCGGQSAGGLAPGAYLDWVNEITDALDNGLAIVILEPDSIALSVECDDPDERLQLVSQAVDRLATTNAAIYLDGGHSNWLPADEMADLLRTAGVDRVRGFATNVSNTQSSVPEREYATRLSDELGGAHAVIDTSRNGNGPPSDAEWCNVPGRAIGETPTAVEDPVVDAVLWIKPPGESDGRCNGGPAAGDWWPDAAIELTGTG